MSGRFCEIVDGACTYCGRPTPRGVRQPYYRECRSPDAVERVVPHRPMVVVDHSRPCAHYGVKIDNAKCGCAQAVDVAIMQCDKLSGPGRRVCCAARSVTGYHVPVTTHLKCVYYKAGHDSPEAMSRPGPKPRA